MARRRSLFGRLFNRLRPKTERRRGSRDFNDRQKREGTPINPDLPAFGGPQFGARQPFGPARQPPGRADPFRREWQDQGRQGSYKRQREFFDSLPAVYDDEQDELDTWRSFQRYMTGDGGGYKFNDPANPFWSQVGLSPRRGGGFNWDEWRQVTHGGRHRDTP